MSVFFRNISFEPTRGTDCATLNKQENSQRQKSAGNDYNGSRLGTNAGLAKSVFGCVYRSILEGVGGETKEGGEVSSAALFNRVGRRCHPPLPDSYHSCQVRAANRGDRLSEKGDGSCTIDCHHDQAFLASSPPDRKQCPDHLPTATTTYCTSPSSG